MRGCLITYSAVLSSNYFRSVSVVLETHSAAAVAMATAVIVAIRYSTMMLLEYFACPNHVPVTRQLTKHVSRRGGQLSVSHGKPCHFIRDI